jgi:hypothetical protein
MSVPGQRLLTSGDFQHSTTALLLRLLLLQEMPPVDPRASLSPAHPAPPHSFCFRALLSSRSTGCAPNDELEANLQRRRRFYQFTEFNNLSNLRVHLIFQFIKIPKSANYQINPILQLFEFIELS